MNSQSRTSAQTRAHTEPPRLSVRHTSEAWLLLILLAVVLRVETDMLDPIHEQFHQEAVWMTGGSVVDRGQSHIRYRGSSWSALVSWAGYGGEVIIFGILALPFRRVGPFYAGLWGIAPFRAVGSVDFAHLGLFADFALWSIWLVLGFWIVCVYYYRYLDDTAHEDHTSTFRKSSQKEVRRARGGH